MGDFIDVSGGWVIDPIQGFLFRKRADGSVCKIYMGTFNHADAESVFKAADDDAQEYGGWASIEEPTISIGFFNGNE